MALPFFYEPDVTATASHFQLSEETSKHCVQVLRMKEGEQLNITNGTGSLLTARIISADKKKSVAFIEDEVLVPRTNKKISIVISLLKNPSRFEWFLEKATELGVSEICPVICDRTEHSRFRFDRTNQVLISAMLQSQQVWLPVLHEPVPFKDIPARSAYQLKLIAHCEQGPKQQLGALPPFTDAQILIGPEGDFSQAEIRSAIDQQFIPVSLGNTRLRTETAGIVAATLLINKQSPL